jgi:GT2 family glycosyltransferase
VTNDAIDVSVVIVNWNTRALLLDVIESLYKTTTRTSMEIIVVDNDSQDGSSEALREAYPEITLIQNNDNLGFAKANNIGFAVARGRAYCLVNTDVIVLDGAIDKLWEYLLAHPEVALVGPRQLNGENQTRQNVRRFPDLRNAAGDYLWLKKVGLLPGRALKPASYSSTHPAEVLSGGFLMVRREAVDQVGPLDEDYFFYGEDTDWARRFHDAGWGIVYHPEAEVIHFGGGSTAAYPVKYYLTMERADLMYWQKHHSAPERAVYLAIKVIYHVVSVIGWAALWLLKRRPREQAILKLRGHAINTVYLITRRSLA